MSYKNCHHLTDVILNGAQRSEESLEAWLYLTVDGSTETLPRDDYGKNLFGPDKFQIPAKVSGILRYRSE
jgi:hypothetical protein